MFDLCIKNVRIIDGTSAPWYRGCLAVQDGKIAAIGSMQALEAAAGGSPAAREIVDGEDLYLTPGFIDIHAHSDTTLWKYPQAESRIMQGVTTEIGGDCGMSVAPVSEDPKKRQQLADYVGDLPYTWNSMGEFLSWMETREPSVNFGTAVGHGSIRLAAMGFDNRKPTEAEMDEMRALLRASLEEGAFCMSSGLIYPPGCFADTEELTELCKELVPYGSFYETHMRNEGMGVVEALTEALTISKNSGAPLQVAHHKVTRKEGWRLLCFTTIAMIDKARRDGMDVQVDQYPYQATATSLDCNLPNWAFEGGVEAMLARLRDPQTRAKIKAELEGPYTGRWDSIVVSYVESEANQKYVGKSIEEIGRMRGVSPTDAFLDILDEEDDKVNEVHYAMCEEDIEYIMRRPYVMIGSDGNAASFDYPGQPHPRFYGTFPRVIAHYCRERGLFTLEEAIFRMTGLPAERLGLARRGLLKPGMQADMVLFDFDTIKDTPTFDNPKQPCEGIRRVYVNGVLTAKDGVHTGARAGEVLRRGRS